MNKVNLTINGKKYEAHVGIGFMELAIKAEKPDDSNIMNISTFPLMYHAISYAFLRKEKECPITKYDTYDWVDEKGLQSAEVEKAKDDFMKVFLESMKTHMPDASKGIDEAINALDKKKKVSKSGKKNGKKTS